MHPDLNGSSEHLKEQTNPHSLTPEEEKRMEEFCAQAFDFARNNDVESLKIMLDHGLSVNFSNHKGDTLLMLASYHNSLEVADLLLSYGANVDQMNNKNQTPLAGVCFKGYDKMAEKLLKYGANPNAGSFTPINCAIMFQRKEILKLLMKHTDKKPSLLQRLYIKFFLRNKK